MNFLKFKIGDQVEITVNYFSDLPDQVEYVRFGTISEIDHQDLSLPYLIAEVGLYFSEDELKLVEI